MQQYKRIVVKVGSSTLTHSDGQLNVGKIKQLVKEMALLADEQYELVLVTSGAVAAGMGKLGVTHKPTELVEHQALAAVGQVELIHLYQSLFFAFDRQIAQLLLTGDDFSHRTRYLNARNTCSLLLERGIIPIINENDSIVVNEIKVGDNDSLSAFVAALIDADLIIILSDIDGYYDCDPRVNRDACLVEQVERITPEMIEVSGGEGSKFGTGGMQTKLLAAEMAIANGTDLILTNGDDAHNITRAAKGERVGTRFVASDRLLNAKKYWLKYATRKDGRLVLDDGAYQAVRRGKSLLPVGVLEVSGEFERGSVVRLIYREREVAVGIVNYSGAECRRIKGRQTSEIEMILGYKYSDVIVHSDNLAGT